MKRATTISLVMALCMFLSIFFLAQSLWSMDLEETKKLTLGELIDGAKKEGKLVWYTSMPMDYLKLLLKKFEEAYPFIKTEFIRGGGLGIAQRFYTEKSKKIETADAVYCGAEEFYPDWNRKGFLARLDNLPEWENIEELAKGRGARYVAVSFGTYVMAWNRNVYKDEEIPTDLWEFTKPEWKDKTATGDPATGAYAAVWYSYASGLRANDPRSPAKPSGLGLKWMQAMCKNGLLLAGQAGNVTEVIVSGRRPIVLKHRDYDIWYANKEGANLGWKYPIQGPVVQFDFNSVNIKAPHPYTGRLFANWLLSREGQLFSINVLGRNIVRKDMKTSDFIKGRRPLSSECWILDIEVLTPEEGREFSHTINNALRGK